MPPQHHSATIRSARNRHSLFVDLWPLRVSAFLFPRPGITSAISAQGAIVASRLDGKAVAVTGGDQGIGRAIVERLAQEGADVVLCYRANKAGADEVVAAVQKLGRKAAAIQCDVGNVADG